MQTYILRRLALAVPTIFLVTVLIFFVLRILPGDPLQYIYGENTGIYVLSEEQLAKARASLGLDKPLVIQYMSWIADVASGDMGTSFWTDQPISATILRRGPLTMQIGIAAVIISWVVGLPIGILAAAWRNSMLDYVARFFITFFMAVPSFWLGMTFILVTVIFFSWKPPILVYNVWDDPMKNLQIMVGPALALGVGLGRVHRADGADPAPGGVQGGLRAHRKGKGPRRAGGHVAARRQKRAASRNHAVRPTVRVPSRRLGRGRKSVLGTRTRHRARAWNRGEGLDDHPEPRPFCMPWYSS